jgi:hypothetical protein
MLRAATVLIAVCGIGIAGCQAVTSPDRAPNAPTDPQPVTPVAFEVYTGFREPARLVVRDAEQWADAWSRLFATRSEPPARPAIDFSTDMVLVAAQGGQGSSGYSISIDRATARGGTLLVDVTSSSADQRCIWLAVITSPVMMVRVPASNSRVEFVEHARVNSCD